MEKALLDIVMREDDFVIYASGKPLLSPLGNEMAHSNARLLRQAVSEDILGYDGNISTLKLLAAFFDSDDRDLQITETETASDFLISHKQNTAITDANLLLELDAELMDFIFLNSSSLHSALNNIILKKEQNQSVINFFSQCFDELKREEKIVLNTLNTEYNVGVTLPYLLIKGFLSATEYAAGIIIHSLKSNNSKSKNILTDKSQQAVSLLHKKVTDDAVNALDFLLLFDNKNKISVIEEIIKRGEDSTTEFKSTLRWDIRQGKKNPAIEHAVLKTICAFLNSEGGDLLIGIKDDGSIEGIESDRLDNNDRFLLHLWMLIKTCLGQEVVEWITSSLQKFGDKTVCRIKCKKGEKPTFVHQKGFEEAFYVRVGPSSSSLDISAALKYIEQHF